VTSTGVPGVASLTDFPADVVIRRTLAYVVPATIKSPRFNVPRLISTVV
jgi:hypothetical protein